MIDADSDICCDVRGTASDPQRVVPQDIVSAGSEYQVMEMGVSRR